MALITFRCSTQDCPRSISLLEEKVSVDFVYTCLGCAKRAAKRDKNVCAFCRGPLIPASVEGAPRQHVDPRQGEECQKARRRARRDGGASSEEVPAFVPAVGDESKSAPSLPKVEETRSTRSGITVKSDASGDRKSESENQDTCTEGPGQSRVRSDEHGVHEEGPRVDIVPTLLDAEDAPVLQIRMALAIAQSRSGALGEDAVLEKVKELLHREQREVAAPRPPDPPRPEFYSEIPSAPDVYREPITRPWDFDEPIRLELKASLKRSLKQSRVQPRSEGEAETPKPQLILDLNNLNLEQTDLRLCCNFTRSELACVVRDDRFQKRLRPSSSVKRRHRKKSKSVEVENLPDAASMVTVAEAEFYRVFASNNIPLIEKLKKCGPINEARVLNLEGRIIWFGLKFGVIQSVYVWQAGDVADYIPLYVSHEEEDRLARKGGGPYGRLHFGKRRRALLTADRTNLFELLDTFRTDPRLKSTRGFGGSDQAEGDWGGRSNDWNDNEAEE